MNGDPQKISAIEKALLVLVALSEGSHEMGTVEIGKKLGFHTATVSRILKILAKAGFVKQSEMTHKFGLGPAILSMVQTAMESLGENLVRVAIPHLLDLCEKVRETVVLEVISGKSAKIAYVAQGKQTLSIRAIIGGKLPAHAAAGAKAIIAFSEPGIIDMFLKKRMPRFTQRTITHPDKLRHELNRVRKTGIAYTREEIDEGVNAIGSPILDFSRKPVAAAAVVGPSARVKCSIHSPIVKELQETTANIAAQLFQIKMDEAKHGKGGPDIVS
jgi:IclR family transcriptional regulator, KDG regulon repressor